MNTRASVYLCVSGTKLHLYLWFDWAHKEEWKISKILTYNGAWRGLSFMTLDTEKILKKKTVWGLCKRTVDYQIYQNIDSSFSPIIKEGFWLDRFEHENTLSKCGTNSNEHFCRQYNSSCLLNGTWGRKNIHECESHLQSQWHVKIHC